MALNICIYQHHSCVGNLDNNVKKITKAYLESITHNLKLDLFVVGELALSGYSPLDLVYNKDYLKQLQHNINKLIEVTKNQSTTLIFGDIWQSENKDLYNVAYVVKKGVIVNIIKKQKLVNYDIFNESRYFKTGKPGNNIIDVNGIKLAVVVCEDLWHDDVVNFLKNTNISGLISINASPYYKNKLPTRINVATKAVTSLEAPVIYVNIVGGVDGVVFDGQSFILDKQKNMFKRLTLAEETYFTFTLKANGELLNKEEFSGFQNKISQNYEKTSKEILQEYYSIIQLGFKNFIKDNSLKGVIIGISGGIDSALAATLAVDTLGSANVIGVSMPSLYTSKLSHDIIEDIGKNLNITIRNFSIDNILEEYTNKKFFIELYSKYLYQEVDEDKKGLFKENLQSRIRGNILMALSNMFPGYVVLSNGNKSELATGYFTLYGDSCGAFNLIKDLFKTEVYALAKWRNENLSKFSKLKKLYIIPQSCINRAPTAELAYNQTDETSLLPYAVLDGILQNLIEEDRCYSELINKFSKKDVDLVLKLLKNSEHKRKQGVIGIKLKNRSFGKEWQYPLTNRFQENDNNN